MTRSMIIACLAGLVAVVGARAEGPPANEPVRERRQVQARMENLVPPRLLEELALTAEQKTKYEEIQAKFAKESEAWKDAHKSEMEQDRESFEAARASGDPAKLQAAREQIMAHRQPMMQLRKTSMDAFRAVLTPDQNKKLDQAREHVRESMVEPGGPGSKAPAPGGAPPPRPPAQ